MFATTRTTTVIKLLEYKNNDSGIMLLNSSGGSTMQSALPSLSQRLLYQMTF